MKPQFLLALVVMLLASCWGLPVTVSPAQSADLLTPVPQFVDYTNAMNQSITVPWKFLLLSAAIAGFFWPLSYVIHPGVALFYTVMVAVAASVFVSSLPPSGEMLSFGRYLSICFVTGLAAQVVAWITIPLFWCRLAAHSAFCTYPHYGGPLVPFVMLSFGLYLFLVIMIYLLIR